MSNNPQAPFTTRKTILTSYPDISLHNPTILQHVAIRAPTGATHFATAQASETIQQPKPKDARKSTALAGLAGGIQAGAKAHAVVSIMQEQHRVAAQDDAVKMIFSGIGTILGV